MIRFRTLLCAASAACGITLGFGAQAQTITTITLPSGGCVVSGSTLDCSGSGGGTTPTPSCSLSASPSASVVAPGSITLTATCSNMTGALTYAWSGDACTSNPSSNKCEIDYSGTTLQSYTPKVTVTDSASPTPNVVGPISKPITFTQAGSGGDGGGGTIPASCSDGTKTVKLATINAFDGFQVGVNNFGAGQVGYWIVNVPPLPANTQIAFSPYQYGNPANMNYYMSKTDVCSTATLALKDATTGSILGGVNDGLTGFTTSFLQPLPKVHMQSGETWYVMVRPSRATSCKSTLCSVYLKPQIQN